MKVSLNYLICQMTKYMDRNITSINSCHFRLLVYYCSEIQSEHNTEKDKQEYINKFNKEIESANKQDIWTPYKYWS